MKLTRRIYRILALLLVLTVTLSTLQFKVEAKTKLYNDKHVVTDASSSCDSTSASIINEEITEDSYLCTLEIKDTSETSGISSRAVTVGYINVSLTSNNNGIIYAKLWSVGTIQDPDLNLSLQSQYTGGPMTTKAIISVKSIGTISNPVVLSAEVSNTANWRVSLSGTILDSPVSYTTYKFLYNKKAVRYPDYTDTASEKKMTVPSTNLSVAPTSQRVIWNSGKRESYINWYNTQFPNGITNWKKYEVHHITPRLYGGTNSYSNFIPLPISYHRATVTPWWANY